MEIQNLIDKIQKLVNHRRIGYSKEEDRDCWQITRFRDSFRHKHQAVYFHLNMIKQIKKEVANIIKQQIHGKNEFLIGDKNMKEKIAFRHQIQFKCTVLISYNSRYKRESHPKSVMKPFYTKKPSQPEQLFMEMLDESDKVEWWFKNGENEIKYFAVPYTDENGYERAFYVDFVVKFKDGTIGLFDTKSGMTAKDAGPRAEGLQKYIKKNKSKKVWGGIAIL